MHPECPLVEGYVRGELHAAYIVAPPRVKASSGYGGNVAKVSSFECDCLWNLSFRSFLCRVCVRNENLAYCRGV